MANQRLRNKLAAHGTACGLAQVSPCPDLLETVGADWDFAWLDAQHGPYDYQALLSSVRACELADTSALIRVPSHEPGMIGRALDTDASGVIVPLVETEEQARGVAAAAKFPPLGNRSYGGKRPIDRIGLEYSETANQETLLVAQIESPAALENVARIVSVDGIDAVLLGPADMCLRWGIREGTSTQRKKVLDAAKKMTDAAHNAGKYSMLIGSSEEECRAAFDLGADMIVAFSTYAAARAGSAAALEMVRKVAAPQ